MPKKGSGARYSPPNTTPTTTPTAAPKTGGPETKQSPSKLAPGKKE